MAWGEGEHLKKCKLTGTGVNIEFPAILVTNPIVIIRLSGHSAERIMRWNLDWNHRWTEIATLGWPLLQV